MCCGVGTQELGIAQVGALVCETGVVVYSNPILPSLTLRATAKTPPLTLQAKLLIPSQVLLPSTLCAASHVGCQQLFISVANM